MRASRELSIITLFTSLSIATDYALAPALNVKLVDTLVFAAAYAFGFRMGAYVGMLSELIWSTISPYGFGGYIIPFLVVGEIMFAALGFSARRVFGSPSVLPKFSDTNVLFGAALATCAFVWDFETNVGTGLIAGAYTLQRLLPYEFLGIPFMVAHELGDFLLGSLLAPVVIVYAARAFGAAGRDPADMTTDDQRIQAGVQTA